MLEVLQSCRGDEPNTGASHQGELSVEKHTRGSLDLNLEEIIDYQSVAYSRKTFPKLPHLVSSM